jgi:hypothetical protein
VSAPAMAIEMRAVRMVDVTTMKSVNQMSPE